MFGVGVQKALEQVALLRREGLRGTELVEAIGGYLSDPHKPEEQKLSPEYTKGYNFALLVIVELLQ